MPKQRQKNFQEVQKTTFLTPKMVKSRVPILKKWQKFQPKIDTFAKVGKVGTRDLTTFGAEKVVFWTF